MLLLQLSQVWGRDCQNHQECVKSALHQRSRERGGEKQRGDDNATAPPSVVSITSCLVVELFFQISPLLHLHSCGCSQIQNQGWALWSTQKYGVCICIYMYVYMYIHACRCIYIEYIFMHMQIYMWNLYVHVYMWASKTFIHLFQMQCRGEWEWRLTQ